MSHQWFPVPVTKTISAITLTATATSSAATQPLRAVTNMNSSTTVRAAGVIAQHAQATSKSIPLSSAAKTLAGYIFGEVSNLTTFLQPYGHIVKVAVGGAGVAGGLYAYFQLHKNNRARIEQAISKIVRKLDKLLAAQAQRLALKENHEELLRLLIDLLEPMVGTDLTKSEGKATALHFKRRLASWYPEHHEWTPRRRLGSALVRDAEPRRAAEEEAAQAEYEVVVPEIVVLSPPSVDDLEE
jgi:hypothetical protein